jgi:hypothetical protein
MAYDPVTVDDFKAFFVRDFPYGTDPAKNVLDADITKALATAGINFNEALWSSQEQFDIAYLNLAAHYLVQSLRASSSGINSQWAGNTQSKGVGSVNESYVMPERVQNSPFLAGLYTTMYGKTYVDLLSLRILGNVVTIRGATTP